MNVTLTKSTPVDGIIKVEVSEADYTDKVNNELKKIKQNASIPGFRKGAVPMGQIKRRYEAAVKSDVLNREVGEAVMNYVREEKLHLLGDPMPVEVKQVNVEDKDLVFEFQVGLAPELDPAVDKTVKIPYYKIEVTDKMIEDQDKELSERFGSQVPGEVVDEKAVIKGSLQQLNEDGSVNTNDGAIQVISAIVAPFTFDDKDEAAKFLGKTVNDKVVFNPYKAEGGNAVRIGSLLNLDKEIAGDIKDDFEFAISEIIVVKPAEHNQEFFDSVAGKDKVHNEEEYTAFIRGMIENQLNNNSVQLFHRDIENYYLEKYGEMELPTEFLKKWLMGRDKELTAENIDVAYEQMLPSLKWQLLRDALATKLEVKVSDKDLLDYAKFITYQQYVRYGITNMDEQTIENSAKHLLEDANLRGRIIEEVSNGRILTAVGEAIKKTEKTVSFDKFKELAAAKAE